jgi:hypothetical protein
MFVVMITAVGILNRNSIHTGTLPTGLFVDDMGTGKVGKVTDGHAEGVLNIRVTHVVGVFVNSRETSNIVVLQEVHHGKEDIDVEVVEWHDGNGSPLATHSLPTADFKFFSPP